MAGRWQDERNWRAENDWRSRDDERFEDFEARSEEHDRWPRSERRSFGQDRVFGERESGVSYNRNRGSSQAWQDSDYAGVSPARRGFDDDLEYRDRLRGQDSGRSYGASDWRNEQSGPYGYMPEGRRFGTAEADRRWAREMQRPVHGGTAGGYGYERGQDDAGRGGRAAHGDNRDFEDRARDAGDFFRRAGQRISNWFTDDDDDDRRRYEAFRGHRGVGPKGYKRSDERISDEVHQRLTDDHWLDASEISCSVSAGEVTLSGTVSSREGKHRAERLVEDISGVSHVQNNLRIDRGSYFTRSGRGFGYSADEAGMASSETLKDVTDGNNGPPAQKKN
jgi:osmotically-inducible protein OsmY